MKIAILGAAGFIGTNLAIKLAQDKENELILVDKKIEWFRQQIFINYTNVLLLESLFETDTEYDEILTDVDVVYHLISTTIPATSNRCIADELNANIIVTAKILDSCVSCGVKKVVFISSGGALYGKNVVCPINEEAETNPITSYGLQKLAIEKMLYIYFEQFGMDYRIVRLANPYGPYQRPNSGLGAVNTFAYKALNGDVIEVFGDGTTVRDYIYIEDAIRALLNIASDKAKNKLYNLGCGHGMSLNELLYVIGKSLQVDLNVKYVDSRKNDIPINYLDVSRYENEFGIVEKTKIDDGIRKTIDFLIKDDITE